MRTPTRQEKLVTALRAQLSSTRQQLERCQKQLAKMRVLANKNARLVQNLDKLSTREKLIFDQCIMKANAKSPKAASPWFNGGQVVAPVHCAPFERWCCCRCRYVRQFNAKSFSFKELGLVSGDLPQGHEVHHCHYSALLEYEEQQAGLRAVPKLTRVHIFPNAFQKMMCRRFQLFSGSTASAIEFYSKQEGCQKLHNSTATYDFTKQMNDLFGCLKSRRPQDVQHNEAEHIARFFG
ncbi:hypothetical protein HPB48_019462 [Haemaphysalis longicornis]|uniref:Transposable element P transposase-like GTP-binding insertion domain-containing protein n=1 Tax=Haemaphysalis longicornis TaxID=44386 RepID=A0A9J6FAT6_HAELO|nr:hypothetical protein HPB48_019462 [Haemaphysalis longicornis]